LGGKTRKKTKTSHLVVVIVGLVIIFLLQTLKLLSCVHARGKLKLVKKKAMKNEKELRFHPAKDVLDVWTGN